MALGSTEPRNGSKDVSWEGKGGRCVGFKPYHLHVPIFYKFWEP